MQKVYISAINGKKWQILLIFFNKITTHLHKKNYTFKKISAAKKSSYFNNQLVTNFADFRRNNSAFMKKKNV